MNNSTDSWDDHWSEVRAKTKPQHVGKTETQRLSRINLDDDTKYQPKKDVRESERDVMGSCETQTWDEHWAEIGADTETQRIKRTETQRIARMDASDARILRRDAHESGFKTGYAQALAEVMSYLRDATHYQKPINMTLFERWHQQIKIWRRNPNNGPPPELIWERHGKFSG